MKRFGIKRTEISDPPTKKIFQNKPRSQIQACDLTSRSFHLDLHADLHDNENAWVAYSARKNRIQAQTGFNWRDALPKKLKNVNPRDTEQPIQKMLQ